MKKMTLALLCTFFLGILNAQMNSNTIFRHGDKIEIELAENSGYFYTHEIKKGHSLYALSSVFDVSLRTLYRFNNITEGDVISVGQKIRIPINNDYLFKGASLSGLKYGHFIPVYYKTKAKDNLFRISRVYFDQPTEDLITRNKLKGNVLSLGQDILIGWFPIDSAEPVHIEERIEEEFEEDFDSDIDNSPQADTYFLEKPPALNQTADIISQDSNAVFTNIPEGFNTLLLGALEYSESMKEIIKSEVANWDKTIPDNGTVYVLHKNAIIDSYVEMYNPNLKRSVRAKVIGRIPYGAYTKNVSLVLSPRAAKQLGALDRRFKVELRALVFEEESE